MAKTQSHRRSGMAEATWSRFGWQGWRLDVPSDWNPVLLAGTGRRGSAVLADLDSARLELTWVSWSGRTRPRLERSIERQRATMADPVVRPADHWPLAETFCDAQELISESPTEVRLVASSAPSRRAVVVRFSPDGLKDGEAVMYRVAASLADVADRPMVPWAVYGFGFAVPQGFELSESRLQTGSAYLSFTGRGGELFRFARVASTGRLGDDVGPADLMAQLEGRARRGYDWQIDEPMTHRGHEVTVRRGVRPGWSRLRRRRERHIDTATWHCPECDRVHEIIRRGPRPDNERIRELLPLVVCHE